MTLHLFYILCHFMSFFLVSVWYLATPHVSQTLHTLLRNTAGAYQINDLIMKWSGHGLWTHLVGGESLILPRRVFAGLVQ